MLQSLQAFCVKNKSSSKFYNILLLQDNTGLVLLKARSFFTEDYWFWICIGALFGFSLLFNVLFIAALTFLNRKSLSLMLFLGYWMAMKFQYDMLGNSLSALGDSKAVTVSDDEKKKKKSSPGRQRAGLTLPKPLPFLLFPFLFVLQI